LSPSLIADIHARLEVEANADTNVDRDNVDSAKNTDTETRRVNVPAVSAQTLAALYEQRITAQERTYRELIQTKDKVIAGKDETIAALKAALHLATLRLPPNTDNANTDSGASVAFSGAERGPDDIPVTSAEKATGEGENGQFVGVRHKKTGWLARLAGWLRST